MPKGILCKLFVNEGAYDAAENTYTEIDILQDVSIAKTKNTFNTTKRRDGGIMTVKNTTQGVVITGKIEVPEDLVDGNPHSDQFMLFSDAWDADTPLHIAALDGDIDVDGSKGVAGYFLLTKFDEDQSNDASVFYDFELQVTDVPFATLTAAPTTKALRKIRIESGNAVYAAIGSSTYA